jgi:hypothetical protein
MKKVANKNKKNNKIVKAKKLIKGKVVTEVYLDKKLENYPTKDYLENTQTILSAVSEMFKESENRMLTYTELRTAEILSILKDERQVNKEKHLENKEEIEKTNNFIKTNVLPRIEKLESK